MNLEQQVCSLELAKKLKELGVKQESLFWWCPGEMDYGYEGEWNVKETDKEQWFLFDHVVGRQFEETDFEVYTGDGLYGSDEDYLEWVKQQKKKRKEMLAKVYSAFTVAELGERINELHAGKWHLTQRFYTGGTVADYIVDYWPPEGSEPVASGCYCFTGDTMVEALGNALVHIMKHTLITV